MYWTQAWNNFLTPTISTTTCVFPVKASELFPCANTLNFVCYFILGRWRQFCGSTGFLPGLLSQVIHGGNDQEVKLRRISERPGTRDTIFISLQEGLASGPFLIDCLARCTDFISYETALFSDCTKVLLCWLERPGESLCFLFQESCVFLFYSSEIGWGWWVFQTQHSRSLWPHTTLWPSHTVRSTELHKVYSKTPGGYWAPGSIFTWFYQNFWYEMAAHEAEH